MTEPVRRSPSNSLATVFAGIVISVAIAGYFIGLQSPMHPQWSGMELDEPAFTPPKSQLADDDVGLTDGDRLILPASHYSEIAGIARQRLAQQSSAVEWETLRPTDSRLSDPSIAPTITSADLNFALETRSLNRAFNGAPPTIPHPIDQMSSQSCMICHGEGFQTATLRASKMSHQYLADCTQCHVESNPQHQPPALFQESTFVGMPAPRGGPRAFPGAPPQIPHSTWMRVDCLSCHGPTGAFAIQTTHPYRQDCQQCHAPSSVLDQVKLEPTPNFLEPPTVKEP